MKIWVLSNNWTTRRGFVAEHGLSLLIESDGRRLLFDTGQGFALPINLAALGMKPQDIDAVALSHGHWDHGGGLAWLANNGGRGLPLFAHPMAFERRIRRSELSDHDIGLHEPGGLRERFEMVEVTEPREILSGLWLTGEISARHEEEAPDPRHMIDRGHEPEPDPFRDDLALFTRGGAGGQGVVVVTGCAHSGVVATLEHVGSLTGASTVEALIGGFHLSGASAERLRWTIENLRRFAISLLAPLHCTGFTAIGAFQSVFGGRVALPGSGDWLEIP
ncbi:MBL fold metallo-hydrolase [Candidatus Sumerlaeota bacterium]|nr:MBL fold metallo-hydrolase [Candidatus Sumerlaeota bacterium]